MDRYLEAANKDLLLNSTFYSISAYSIMFVCQMLNIFYVMAFVISVSWVKVGALSTACTHQNNCCNEQRPRRVIAAT